MLVQFANVANSCSVQSSSRDVNDAQDHPVTSSLVFRCLYDFRLPAKVHQVGYVFAGLLQDHETVVDTILAQVQTHKLLFSRLCSPVSKPSDDFSSL